MTTFLGVIAAGTSGYALCLFVTRVRQAELAHGFGLIRRWMDSNDTWALEHQALFAAEQPHLTGEIEAVRVEDDEPALSAESHDDEQAPDEDDDHAGWWQMLLALVWDLADLVHEHTPWGWLRVWFGPGEEMAPTGQVLTASGYDVRTDEEIAAELAELTGEPVNAGPYRGRHWVSDVQHTGAWPLVVPAQRDGGDDL